MYVFCLVLSVVAAALGLFALGFGLSPYEGSLGNALLMVGAVGIVGGMIMFGLAAVVRQLRHVAEALGPRTAATMVRRPATPEAVDVASAPAGAPAPAQRQPAGPRGPFPPRPGADQRGPAPPPPPPLAEAPEGPGPAERQRPPLMEEEVPLAPSRALAPHMVRGGPSVAEPPPVPEPSRPPEPRPATQADIMARLSNLAVAPPRPVQRPEPSRAPPPPPPPPPVERAAPAEQRRANMFDSVWPAEVRAARQSQSETIARVPRPESRLDARPDMRPEPGSEQRSEQRADPRQEPRFDSRRERMEPGASGAAREPMMPPPAEPRPIAILKSGVIDGMAYTLYTDGSIEAELPQGTMRFASIDELRSHLEKTERQA